MVELDDECQGQCQKLAADAALTADSSTAAVNAIELIGFIGEGLH
jgi:hypothetical protein